MNKQIFKSFLNASLGANNKAEKSNWTHVVGPHSVSQINKI